MNIRKNVRWLTNQERSNFLKAVVSLKGLYRQSGGLTMNVYDFYPVEHRVVRHRRLASNPAQPLGNGGHDGPGFLPWHREWLRRFEMDLQSVDSTVTLPYWDILDPVGSKDVVFKDDFMGPDGTGPNGEIQSGYFRENVPTADRPTWWPDDENGTPLPGFQIRQSLSVEERPLALQRHGFNTTTLTRQFGLNPTVDPWTEFITRTDMEVLLDLPDYDAFEPPFEGMDFHGWGHVWSGGLMGRPPTSPNDPMFFLHHCMVDHVWALWQGTHDQTVAANLPPTRAASPRRRGHNIDDLMWPWDGSVSTNPMKAAAPTQAPFPSPTSMTPAPVYPDDTFLREVVPGDTVHGEDVIDHRSLRDSMGYVYDTQIPYVLRQGNEVFAWIEPFFGDLNLLGTIRENDSGGPTAGDLVLSPQGGGDAWFDANTKDLHLPGRAKERETDMRAATMNGSWIAEHYNQPLAYVKSSGDLHLKGTIRTNQPLAPNIS